MNDRIRDAATFNSQKINKTIDRHGHIAMNHRSTVDGANVLPDTCGECGELCS
jgi:hypothetical protein